MAPRVDGPHITAFYANGTASDAVYGPGDSLTLRFSRATNRAPALQASRHVFSPHLLACSVDVGGEARAVPLGVVEGAWLADDLLQLTVQSTAGAAPALLVRGAPSAVGVGLLRCCVLPDGFLSGCSALGFGVPCTAVRPSLSSRSALAWHGRESAAEGDRGNRTEHHREHHPGPGERQHSAQGDAEAE